MGDIIVCMISPTGEHLYTADEDDRRFKICRWCGNEAWRTDEELMKEAGLDKERREDAE